MNAVSVFRLFTRLFLGKRRTGFTVMADALPRERWILTAGVLFVVLGGLFPNAIVAQRSAEADIVEQVIVIHKPIRPVQVPEVERGHQLAEPGAINTRLSPPATANAPNLLRTISVPIRLQSGSSICAGDQHGSWSLCGRVTR
jgi:hypothetical protein